MAESTEDQATRRIQNALDQVAAMASCRPNSPEFIKWRRDTGIAIERIFGANSRQVNEFGSIRFPVPAWSNNVAIRLTNELAAQEEHRRQVLAAGAILESMKEEVREYGLDNVTSSQGAELRNFNMGNKVFVIHGRDEEAKQTVARFLSGLDLEPVILQEQASKGNTIIEKFEEHAQSAAFAVALCTPDDIGGLADESDNLKSRMRQNVVFELGYFAGAIGRNRVCALMKGTIERPSDYDGVVYIPMDSNEGWKLALARELKAAGFDIDLNRVL